MIVQKYGGSSVKDQTRILAVAEHVRDTVRSGEQVLVVVSAMGDQTNLLLSQALAISPTPPLRELDLLLSAGERISMSLLSIAIDSLGIASRSFTGSQSGIITDATHGDAKILRISPQRILQAFQEVPVIIVAGFQGVSDTTKDVTTLGRGGSDLTAIALADAMGAKKCELYKDVDGVFSADPVTDTNAKFVPHLNWQQLSTITKAGNPIVHHRAALLAEERQLPLNLKNSYAPHKGGTSVGHIPASQEIIDAMVVNYSSKASI